MMPIVTQWFYKVYQKENGSYKLAKQLSKLELWFKTTKQKLQKKKSGTRIFQLLAEEIVQLQTHTVNCKLIQK